MGKFIAQWLMFNFVIRACSGLYEDQIGKFEWRRQFVGKIRYAHFDVSSLTKKVIVASEQNVLAALSLKTGDIIWRQILESDDNGTIKLLSIDKEILTISGTNSPLVRGWDMEHGYLLWEWGLNPYSELTNWIFLRQKLIQIDFNASSHLTATMYQISTGKKVKTQIIPATWLIPEKCVLQNEVVACISSDKSLYSVKITEESDDIVISIHHRSLLDLFKEDIGGSLKTTTGKLPVISVNVGNEDVAIVLQPEIHVLKTKGQFPKVFSSTSLDQHTSIATSVALVEEMLHVESKTLEGTAVPELSSSLQYGDAHGHPEFAVIFCQPRKDRGTACRLLISTSHDTLLLMQHPGKILWTREESLASVLSVEMVNLPVSDTDAAIEKEFDNKNSGFIGMFFRRILSQTFQLQNSVLMLLGLLKGISTVHNNETMIQDEFGLHKLIIATTKVGKIFGIDNLSGNIVWQIKIDNVGPLSTGTTTPVMPLYLLRNARHHPLPPECALLVKYKPTGETALVVFNPITGSASDKGPVIRLGIRVKQSLLLHLADEKFYKGIILLDENNKVHVYPESSTAIALSSPSSTFIYTVDAHTGTLEGFTLTFSTKEQLISNKMWRICLGGKVIAVVGKNQNEKVHSQGRVLGDRSVLYKYVNPNLIAVVTRAQHPVHKSKHMIYFDNGKATPIEIMSLSFLAIINLNLIDAVSGGIIYSASHRRAKEPVHVVHSENWVVYTYMNEKYRRTELGALEMYEGKTQSNATVFSSLDSAILLPIVERQAYILPANVLALKETITEKGITSKHILVALSTGGILEMPWAYADPRRPMTVTPEMREEGVIPYMPELPTPLEAIINHNQTINNIRGMHTSSSGLESTCLVFAYGLDIFYTRVAPSKTFDLLKDDFDYYIITIVLMALSIVSYITKRLASRKALRQAWK
ncbi:hypothetical protein RUM43_003783 [Polyplax serrata]|uniref:ER membrane protein complex subunit 1 n=1 Tax=Polyplax serrata TaxID=468196 RepID=A0AAN8S5R7_POLSC